MTPPVLLGTILSEFPLAHSPLPDDEIAIHGIAIDSRKVQPGDLFVARRGGNLDGHDFIQDAIARGAVVVIGERETGSLPVPYIRVDDSLQAVTWLAAGFHGHPGRKLTVIGVTGTDGKTTTCGLLHNILQTAGLRAGMISTVSAIIGDEVLDTGFHVTTPDAPDVQALLARMVAAGLTHVILETTSHGLAQHRTDAVGYDLAVFTNITHEHLDQHGSYEAYRAAKARLLDLLAGTGTKPQGNLRLAVLNRDDASYSHLAERASGLPAVTSLSYGFSEAADFRVVTRSHTPAGQTFQVVAKGEKLEVKSRLIGEFNVLNCLAALTAAIAGLGVDPQAAAAGIAAMKGVRGRMERVDEGQEFTVVVDFAHTPNALRVAINTVREMSLTPSAGEHQTGKKPRLITVFGSAGLRDKEKRRLMAKTSAELADISILTAEDPRIESLDAILAEMAEGARSGGGVEGKSFFRIPDRGEAIRTSIRLAQPGDYVVVCGKGHEQSMCFGDIEYPWDDRIAVQAALAEHLGIPGPQMPHLPTADPDWQNR